MSGSIFDALNSPGTDPSMMGLIGAAGGFAQAAMPQPYKGGTPFGAVLGMGAQGMGQGYGQAYQNQDRLAQAQGQQIANAGNASALPVTVARNQMLAKVYQDPSLLSGMLGGGGSAPAAPTSAGSASAGAPGAPAPSPAASLVPSALSSISDPNARSMAVNAAMKANLPAAAWAPWIAGVHNESGWNLAQADGSAGEIGPGQVKPATAQGMINPATTKPYTTQDLRDPATNLTASAQYFGQQWQKSQGDPVGALTGYNTGDVAGNAPGYTQKALARLNDWGGATGTGAVTPQSALGIAQNYEQQADALEQQQSRAKVLQSMGLPVPMPVGDPAAKRAAAQQYRALALAGPTSQAQAQGKANVDLTTAGPIAAAEANAKLPATLAEKGFRQNADGTLAAITGGPADPSQVGAQAAATANAQAAADRTKLITTRAGVFDPVSGKEIYRQPEYHELQDPNGREWPAFVQPGDNGQINVMGGPPGVPNGTPSPSKIAPGTEDIIQHLADQYATEDKQKYEGATNSLFQLDQQDKNIAALNAGAGWSATGAGANARLDWAKNINSGFAALGAQPPFDPAKVSNWEDATKIQTQLAFAQAKQLGSREAQQVISMSRAATPGAENTPQGYAAISSGYHEMNNREVDLYNFKTQWLQDHGGNLTGAETAFNNQYTPSMYAQRAVSNVKPPVISGPQQFASYLPGTYVTDGKTIDPQTGRPKIVQIPPRPGAPQIPTYLQQGAQNAP